MQFNSLIFLLFFFIVYSGYLLSKHSVKGQNLLLLVASYVFYGFWDWRFLSLLLTSTVIDFFLGKFLAETDDKKKRKLFLASSLTVNLSILGFFKYFNFFADSFSDVLVGLGMQPDFVTLNVILPIGISFYTFQTLSYTFDIYRGKLKPTKSFINFALFVSFFPQLVAGPIERASNLLPQIAKRRTIKWSEVDAGLFLILWGYFKKVVIADNVGLIADTVFNDYSQFGGLDLIIGILAFTVQIYCDFSGYSDIARGLCKLMGFELMVNFRLPYFALNPSDFWNRWHISLSTWLKDYLYISLGGNQSGAWKTYRNLMITMILGGLWHGAAWNFVIWGMYHGTILCLYRAFEKKPVHKAPWSGEHSSVVVISKMILMFTLTLFGWLIFRSQSVEQITYFILNLGFSLSKDTPLLAYKLLFFSMPLIVIQLYQYIKGDLLVLPNNPIVLRSAICASFLTGIVVFGVRDSLEFIYFQF